ncbi:hypothetical protein SAMN04487952_102133 [Halomonas caseinilytica]|nr:hypothetical protein SAMN04487952_102133 [Halomonas caseinilytica]
MSRAMTDLAAAGAQEPEVYAVSNEDFEHRRQPRLGPFPTGLRTSRIHAGRRAQQ